MKIKLKNILTIYKIRDILLQRGEVMEIKLNDVYKFRYHEEVRNKKAFDLYWCFDGQLVVKENKNGLYLEDTYWSSDSRKFTLEEALKDGILTFVCNLDDVVECGEYDTQFYADEDIFNLSHQKGCYKKYCVRKDVNRSTEKMKFVLAEKIKSEERKIQWATSDLKRYKEKLQEVENGNLDIYI